MKKVFIIIASLIMVAVISLLIVLNTVRKDVSLKHKTPVSVSVYYKTSNPKTFNEGTELHSVVMEKLNNVANMTLFDRLIKLKTIDTKLEVADSETYVSWTPEISNSNVVVELTYNEEQDVLVYEKGNTRVISYFCAYYVFNLLEDFTDIVVYYSSNNDTTIRKDQYAKSTPIIVRGYTQDLVEYIKSL